MLIKNKSDPLIHIRSVLERRDLSKLDKILLIRILIEPYIQLEFSPTEYSKIIGVSKSGINDSLYKLSDLKILKRKKKDEKQRKRYKYILDCKLL